jgi:DNA-binding NarL/FixJ family response regulator
MTVLIIDDSPAIAARLTALLGEVPGAEITGWAKDAREAHEFLDRCRPDAVILDFQLGDDAGIVILRHFRSLLPKTVFIVFTNFALPHNRQACMQAGADHFLDKSLEFHNLPELLAALCAAKKYEANAG